MKKAGYLVLFLILVASHADAGQWVKRASPIISASTTTGRFDDGYVSGPVQIIQNGDTVDIFYVGGHTADQVCREKGGLVTTTDFITFTPVDGPGPESSLLGCGTARGCSDPQYTNQGDCESNDEVWTEGDYDGDRQWFLGTILREDATTWKLWSPGDADMTANHEGRIGYNTATTGTNWSKYAGSGYGGSIFEDMDGATESPRGILAMAVSKLSGTDYRAIYDIYPTTKIKYAKSTDGITWSIQNSGNPVFNTDVFTGVTTRMVGNTVYAYTETAAGEIAVRTSTDWLSWSDQSVILSPSGSGWDSHIYYATYFQATNGRQYLIYVAIGDGFPLQIGIADWVGGSIDSAGNNHSVASAGNAHSIAGAN